MMGRIEASIIPFNVFYFLKSTLNKSRKINKII
jgi:hypothetical protein